MGFLGAHVSAAGGVEKTISRGVDLGCEAVQIFSKNQRQWQAKPLTEASIDGFRQQWQQSEAIGQTVIHDSYLINLAHPEAAALKKSHDAFLDEMMRADQLHVPWLVFHPGAHLGKGVDAGIETIADSLKKMLERHPDGQVTLLLENTAGMGSHIGSRLEELAGILERVNHPRLGVCVDTAHAFEAGYDIRNDAGYDAFFHRFQALIGLDRLNVFHINDSKTPLKSRVDRHENIGQGEIGADFFRRLVNDQRFESHPMILETPGGDERFKENLTLLKSFRNSI